MLKSTLPLTKNRMSADEIVLPPGEDTNSLVSEPDGFYNWLILLFLLSLLINILPWLAYWLVEFFRVNDDAKRISSDASVEVEANQEPIPSSSINRQEQPDEAVDVRAKTKKRTIKWTETENTLRTVKEKNTTSPINEKEPQEQPEEVADRGAKTENRTHKWTESNLKNLTRKNKLKNKNGNGNKHPPDKPNSLKQSPIASASVVGSGLKKSPQPLMNTLVTTSLHHTASKGTI